MKNKTDLGFTYIDVMIALVILMVGILALLSAITSSVIQSRGQEQQLLAKQIAASTMESIMSVKETDPDRLGWDAIGNIGSNVDPSGISHGIFLNGFQPAKTRAGNDEVIGTPDDDGVLVSGIDRRIVITDICDPDRPSPICNPAGNSAIRIRSIEVTVRYRVGNLQRQEQVKTVLADYSVSS